MSIKNPGNVLDTINTAGRGRLVAIAAALFAPSSAVVVSDAAALAERLVGDLGDLEFSLFAEWCAVHKVPVVPSSIVGWDLCDEDNAELWLRLFDYRAAAGFILWLVESGAVRRDPRLASIRAWFGLDAVARWGSSATRAVVAAWLADPWFPEAASASEINANVRARVEAEDVEAGFQAGRGPALAQLVNDSASKDPWKGDEVFGQKEEGKGA